MPNASISCINAAALRYYLCMPLQLGFRQLSAISSNKLSIAKSRMLYSPEDYISELTRLLYSADYNDCSSIFYALYRLTSN
jgi:hypothetical protein